MGICNQLVTKVSLIVLGETQRNKFNGEPALSFVPEALAPQMVVVLQLHLVCH
jgi:hypothetical protein